MLHSEAPDYDPQADTKGSGLLSGAPAVTPIEKEHLEWLQTLYAERRRWRPGDRRFCAPGVATASLLTRYARGVPPEVAQLPIKILVMVRHPSDVVIERLQAKPVKGMAVYPECSISTIGKCADELCGAQMRMLDDLKPAAQADRLKVVKWESLIRRRQRASADLHAWIGMGEANSTALIARLADGITTQQSAFTSLAKAYPISLQSLRLVEQRCSAYMQRMEFSPTADVAVDGSTGSTQKRRHAKRFTSKKRRRGSSGDENADAAGTTASPKASAPRDPLLLLRRRKQQDGNGGAEGHAARASKSKPKAPSAQGLMWCPVRLTGASALAQLFVNLDVPRATRAPPCFPGSKEDVCPVPRSAAWMPARWGAYPLEVIAPQLGEPSANDGAGGATTQQTILGGFSFAFVRNPWSRLASAYAKLIAIEDQRTAVHRTWIREMHGLGEKDPIGFSHFVRWVAAQDPASMHRAWRPFTRTCHFDVVKYSFIGRFETFQRDVERLSGMLHMDSERDRRVWQRVNSETRPLVPHEHPDHLLKLHHLYFSDDRHDLIEIVRQKYRDDITLFEYNFPRNQTLAPWEASGFVSAA